MIPIIVIVASTSPAPLAFVPNPNHPENISRCGRVSGELSGDVRIDGEGLRPYHHLQYTDVPASIIALFLFVLNVISQSMGTVCSRLACFQKNTTWSLSWLVPQTRSKMPAELMSCSRRFVHCHRHQCRLHPNPRRSSRLAHLLRLLEHLFLQCV